MFKCANDECKRKVKPGEKPEMLVTKYRTVGYAENGVLYSTGTETVEELPFCLKCKKLIGGLRLEADVVGHKVINVHTHKRTGKVLRVELLNKEEDLHDER